MSDAAIGAVFELIDGVGFGRAMVMIAITSAAVFALTFSRAAAKILAETYTVRAAETVWRRLADWIVALGAALSKRRAARVEAAEDALSILDDFETEGGATGLRLLIEAVLLGWQAPETAAYRAAGNAYHGGAFRRLADLVVASVLLVFTAPILALVAMSVLVSIGRPVLFAQERVGLDGRPFKMYKFRTMLPDRRISSSGHYHGPERRSRHRSPHDPRLTRAGRVMRTLSLDELPQLINVVRNDMTLVGPRPELAALSDQQDGHPRTSVRPGLTGLAQVTDAATWDEMLDADEEYVKKRSLRLDLWIIVMTIVAVFRNRDGSSRR